MAILREERMSALDLHEMGEQPTEELKRGGRKSRPLISQNFWDLHSKKLGRNSAHFLTNLKREFNAPPQILTDPCRFFCHIYLQSAPSVLSCIDKSLEGIESKDFFGCYTGFFLFCKKREAEQYVTIRYVHKDSKHYLLCFKMFARRTIRFPDEMFMKDQKESEDLVLIPEENWKKYKMMSREKRQPVILGTVPDIEKISGDSPVAKKLKKRSKKDENFEAVSGSDESDSDSGSDEEVAPERREAKRHKKKRRSKGQGEPGAGSDPSDDRQAGQGCAGASGSCAGASGMGVPGQEGGAGSGSGTALAMTSRPEPGALSEQLLGLINMFSAEAIVAAFHDTRGLMTAAQARLRNPTAEDLRSENPMHKSIRIMLEKRSEDLNNLPKREVVKVDQGSFLRVSQEKNGECPIADYFSQWICHQMGIPLDLFKDPPQDEPKDDSVEISGFGEDKASLPLRRRNALWNLRSAKEKIGSLDKPLSYISLAFQPRQSLKNVYFVAFLQPGLSKQMTCFFPSIRLAKGEQLRFAVLFGAEALHRFPKDYRRCLGLDSTVGLHVCSFTFDDITELPHESLTEYFCTKPQIEIMSKYNEEAKKFLVSKGRSIHEIVEEQFLAHVIQETEDYNKAVVFMNARRERILKRQMLEGRDIQETPTDEEKSGCSTRSKKKKQSKMSMHMKYNPPIEERASAPEKVQMFLLPFLFLPICSKSNSPQKGVLHSPGCSCAGKAGVNPLVHPFFRTLMDETTSDTKVASCLKKGSITIPDTLLGLADCQPICHLVRCNV